MNIKHITLAVFALTLITLVSINCLCLIFNKQQGNDALSVVSNKANSVIILIYIYIYMDDNKF